MAVGGEEGDQDNQAAGHKGRQAGLIQPRDWLFRSEILFCFGHRSERDPKRSGDGTQVAVRMASVELPKWHPRWGSGPELAQPAIKGQATNAIDQQRFLTEREQQQLGFGIVLGERPQGC